MPANGRRDLIRRLKVSNAQQTQAVNIYVLSGIRTCDPSNHAATYLRLRLRVYRYRLNVN